MDDIFESSIRRFGDMAGVFEVESGAGYFYLYEVKPNAGGSILRHLLIAADTSDFKHDDIAICWSPDDRFVGLKVARELRAVFDCETKQGFGGRNVGGSDMGIPSDIRALFCGHDDA